jgi:hypothetical protein
MHESNEEILPEKSVPFLAGRARVSQKIPTLSTGARGCHPERPQIEGMIDPGGAG